MIKIVNLSSNPLSGSPYELNKLLNRYSTTIHSRLIQGTSKYINDKDIPERSFPYDLLWNEKRDECIELIKEADIIHLHNSLFPENLKDYINSSQKIILQLYSVYREKLQPLIDRALEINPLIVIADQPWQKKVYSDLSNSYLPLVKTTFSEISQNSNPIIAFAPTNRLPLSHPYSKGYYEVLEILYRLKQKYNFDLKLIESINYEENLIIKETADIIIDDVINENAFHGTSLEAVCFGAIPLTNFSNKEYPFIKTSLNTLEKTLENYLQNPSALKYDKHKIKEWQLNNYNTNILIERYETFYKNCIETEKIEIDNIINPYETSKRMEKSKTYLFQIMVDWLNLNKIPFFLSFGSALKAYRDDEHALDADLGVFYDYKWKVRELIKNNLPSEVMMNCIWRGEITFRLKNSNYPKLDIIFFDKQSDFYQCNIYSKNPLNGFITWERGLKISHKALENFKIINFKERSVSIPKNIDLYLTENYTKEWKTPIKNKPIGWGSRPCADYNHRQIAILIPTFIRPNKVKDCINSILNIYPKDMIRIYVGDQSDEIAEEMQSFYLNLESMGHKYFRLPFNCGLSYARNYLVSQISTEPYVMIIDDDFIFTNKTDLSKFIDVLEEQENHGICGGNIEGRFHYAGWLSYLPSIRKILKIDIFNIPQTIQLTTEYNYKQRKISYYYSDIVLNFFLAKREIFKNIEWDNELILCEHTDFFLRLKNTPWKVCYAPEVTIQHSSILNEEKYKNYRHSENKKIGIERFCLKWKINDLNDIWRLSSKVNIIPEEQETKEIEEIKESIVKTFPIIQKNEENAKLDLANKTENSIDIFREIIQILERENIDFCLLKSTCLQVVLKKDFLEQTNDIYFGVIDINKIIKILVKMNYVYNNNAVLTKNNINIHFLPLPKNTKRWTVGDKILNVPFPLIKYLEIEYKKTWKELTNE